MAYIGKSESDKIRAENAVDVITISNGEDQYVLSQDVPGASESNIMVVVDGVVFEPEVKYKVEYNIGTHKNDLLIFNPPIPNNGSVAYVVHKGSSTFNLAPSPGSVTDASLCENLRNFLYDNFTGVTGQTTFGPLIKQEYSPESLLVTVNGVVKLPGNDTPTNDYHLVQVDNTTNIVFHSAPANGSKIGIGHLAFSTVLRRASYPYVPAGSAPPGGWISSDIADDAINDDKIRLRNDKYLNSNNSAGVETGLIKLNASNQADIYGKIIIDAGSLYPTSNGVIALGSTSHKFKNLNVAYDVIAGSDVSAVGNVTAGVHVVAGNSVRATAGDVEAIAGDLVAGADLRVGANANITGSVHIEHDLTVHGTFNLAGQIADAVPIGSIIMYYGTTAPAKYLFCDGATIQHDDYPALYDLCMAIPNNGPHVPNMKQRFPLGRNGVPFQAGAAVGEIGGNFSPQHVHAIPNHHHDIVNGNLVLLNPEHNHNNISGSVSIRNHNHYLNSHYHNTQGHEHLTEKHLHTASGTSGSTNLSHTHGIEFNLVDVPAGSGADKRVIPNNPTGGNAVQTLGSSVSMNHNHSVSLTTDKSGGIVLNGGTTLIPTDVRFPQTAGISSGSWDGTSNVPSGTLPWNQCRFNRLNSVDPGNMTEGAAQIYPSTNFQTTEDATFQNSRIQFATGRTEIIEDQVTYNNADIAAPQPYLTVNFIIRALP